MNKKEVLVFLVIILLSTISVFGAPGDSAPGGSGESSTIDLSQTNDASGTASQNTAFTAGPVTATGEGAYSATSDELLIQHLYTYQDTSTSTEGADMQDVRTRRDGSDTEMSSTSVFRGNSETTGSTFEVNDAGRTRLYKSAGEYNLESDYGAAVRVDQTFVTGYNNFFANLNQRSMSWSSSESVDDRGTPEAELNFQGTSAIIFNNGEMAFRQLDGTTARTDEIGRLKYLKTSSTTDNNIMIIPGPTIITRLENIDFGKIVELEFQGSQTKLILDKDITGNLNSLINFRTLDSNAILNSYKIGKQITITTEKTELEFPTFNFLESFRTNGKSRIVFNDEDGIEYIEAAKDSIYTYHDKNTPEKSFTLKFNQDFKLRVRKSVAEPAYSEYDGMVDFVDKNIILKGKTTYTRETDIYTSEDKDTIAVLSMDDDFNNINEISIESLGPAEPIHTRAGPFYIREAPRQLYIPDIFTTQSNIIDAYKTNWYPIDINFMNNLLTQGNMRIYAINNPRINSVLDSLSTERYKTYLK